ncbi:MAG TPA: adenylate/guanylate cyclase domain-containing protein [Actinomycetota bacterium]|nr:adenylate/guanylate cyclase domain-containing protein [Actinomycetota bacterium]
MLCPSCGKENPEGFRFCGFCSTPLEPQSELGTEVRKTVTVLFCDVTGSTTIGELLDPETVRRVMGRYFDEMKEVLESHGGTVEKFIGDAVMAVFGVPVVHEDDALRGVRAAVEMRDRLGRLNKELERDHGVSIIARTGVNTGGVVAGPGAQTLVTGDAVNVAARLEQAAPPGEILIGADTHELVRDAVQVDAVEPVEAKGRSEPVRAFRLVSVEGPEGLARRFDVPMVGRVDELRALVDALGRAERDHAFVLATVLGTAGVGKSRLVQEFLERVAMSAEILHGRCLPYGDGITYWPVAEMLTAASGILDVDGPDQVRAKIAARVAGLDDAGLVAERLAQLLGVADAIAAPDETHWAVRKFFESMASTGPLVVLIEDVHWAEPSLLDLIEHIADWSRDAPILLLCTARPELLDERPGWGGGKLNATSFLLGPLSDLECDELVANLLQHADLSGEARRRITEAAEGNPLFVEQMVAMLIDDGLLRREGGAWVLDGDLSEIAPPASITALLEARLERLDPAERSAIERASIEGKQFQLGSVLALSPGEPGVRDAILSLVRRDLIRPDRSAFAGDAAFRFRHILIRDAAYNRIPKATRAEFHERHAGWLEAMAGDPTSEFEEIVGYHLERAYRLRSELGPLDGHAGEIASRAAAHLLASSRRAADRGDARASSNLLSRGMELLPSDDPNRSRLLPVLSLQLMDAGDTDGALAALEEAESRIESQEPSVEFAIRFARLTLDAVMEPEGVARRMKLEAERAIPRLEAIGDDAGLARAWHLIGEAELFWANNAGMLDAFGRALGHAERAGDRAETSETVTWCMIATYSGETRPDEGLRSIEALAGRAPNNLEVMAWSQIARGRFLGMLGRLDEGRGLVRAGRAVFEDLGLTLTLGGSSMEVAAFDEEVGEIEAAERTLREGYELLSGLGEKGYLSTVAGRLARCVALRGDLDEAEGLTRVSERTAATDDVNSQVAWRHARALVHAKRGEADQALAHARQAVVLTQPSDDCHLRGIGYESLAEVHRLAGRSDEAAEALRRAIEVWGRKGAIFVAERLGARLAELTGP